MALAVDSSSPAVADGEEGTATSTSFTAPAGSLLVALCAFAGGSGTHSVTNNGSALTWTRRVNRQQGEDSGAYAFTAAIYTATTVTSVSRTVTANNANSQYTALKVLVFTGANLTNPVGATGEGNSSTANLTVNGYTSTFANSWGVAMGADNSNFQSPSTSDVGFPFNYFPSPSGIAVRKAAATASTGTTVTFNFNGSASRTWNWVAAEIRPLAMATVGGRGHMIGQAVHRASTY